MMARSINALTHELVMRQSIYASHNTIFLTHCKIKFFYQKQCYQPWLFDGIDQRAQQAESNYN